MMKGSNKIYVLAVVAVLVVAAAFIGGLSSLGLITGTTQLNVAVSVAISLPVSTVDFGSMSTSQTNDTSDSIPGPFEIQNDGNVRVNVTINATDLFSTASNPTANYRFAANTSSEGTCFDTGSSTTAWTNMPSTATRFLTYLNFTDSCDLAEVEIEVTVPANEPAGAKSSTVTFLASQA